MIGLCDASKAALLIALFAVLVLSGCVTSNEVLFDARTAPLRAGKYELQYSDGDGKWTKFATGSLALIDGRYRWTENGVVSSPFRSNVDKLKFALVDIGNGNFIIVADTADLKNPIWAGNYRHGIGRRAGGAFLYDFPTCLDLRVSQGFANQQVEENRNTRVPVFQQDTAHRCVDDLCKTYGRVETTGAVQSVKRSAREAGQREPGHSHSQR